MTTDTEALRAQFERRMNLRGWSEANIRRDGLDYSSTQLTEAWHAFQAGHAAATAETAAAVAAERERAVNACIDIATDQPWTVGISPPKSVAMDCAVAIRAGAKEHPNG